MAATFTWTIEQLKRNTADDGVTTAYWRCTGVEGDNLADTCGSVSFLPDPAAESFIAFDDLTEADVLGWVQAEVDKDDTEARLQAQLDEIATPATVMGTPWAAPAE